jgi:hypothetical protein
MARLSEIPSAPLPIPRWLPELAEAIAGQSLDEHDLLESVPVERLLKLRNELQNSPESDPYSRWAKWFFADRSSRASSPSSPTTVPEYVEHRVQENTFDSLQEAVRLAPANGLALARLARHLLRQDAAKNPRRIAEADWCSRRAVLLAPTQPEVLHIRAEVLERAGQLSKSAAK